MIQDDFSIYELTWASGAKTQVYLSDGSYHELLDAWSTGESVFECGGAAFSLKSLKGIVNLTHQQVVTEEIFREESKSKVKKRLQGRERSGLLLKEETDYCHQDA